MSRVRIQGNLAVMGGTMARIKRARETRAAVDRIRTDPSPENEAALHRLHARHLRVHRDFAGAVRAEARAKQAESAVRGAPEPTS